jgi:hypothetical protein
MSLAFDLAGRVEELSVAQVHGLGPVRTDVHPGADRAIRRAVRESLLCVHTWRLERKPDRCAGRKVR